MKRAHEHGHRHLVREIDRLNRAVRREAVRERLPFNRSSDDSLEPFSNRRVAAFGDGAHQGRRRDLQRESENQWNHRLSDCAAGSV
jgi:hypothetical protein